MRQPEKLLYSKTHEWVEVAAAGGTKVATVGLSAFALQALTDLVYIDLPQPGRQVSAGESFGEVESVKSVSELFTPVSGEIVEVNDALDDAPETVNEDPYGDGWLIKVKLSDPSEVDGLMDADGYEAFLAEEA